MPDVFISYSSLDGILARQLRDSLEQHGVETFLAEISIQPGSKWKDSIIEALNQSKWVFFLATPAAIASQAVMHEIGGALFGKKQIVTILCDVGPGQLPDWIKDTQAIDSKKQGEVLATVQKVAEAVKSDRFVAGLIGGGLLLWLASALSK